jgi:hypothetical protein
MYLPGQLPYGPQSSNQGGQANLDGNMAPLLTSADLTGLTDPSGGPNNTEATYLLPGAGNQIVNPSIATGNGIVQTPITSPASRTRLTKIPGNGSDSCGAGLSGLGDGISAAAYLAQYGRTAPDPETCLQIQCGTISQDEAGLDLIAACADFGYAGVKACVDPGCNCPPSPSPQSIIAAAPPSAPPNVPGYVPITGAAPVATPCGGYAASSVLPMLANDAGRGMGACCQSGYQSYQTNQVAAPDSSLAWWVIGGAILLMLTPSGSGRKK